jgi:predicted small metal-binding protein
MKMPAPHVDEAKRIACAEIVPDCPFTASAGTEEELLQKVVAHAAHDHGITEVTPELAAKVKAAIRTTEKRG